MDIIGINYDSSYVTSRNEVTNENPTCRDFKIENYKKAKLLKDRMIEPTSI